MSELVPRIKITDPQSKISRPLSGSASPSSSDVAFETPKDLRSRPEPNGDEDSQASPVALSRPATNKLAGSRTNGYTENTTDDSQHINSPAIDPLSQYISKRTNAVVQQPQSKARPLSESNSSPNAAIPRQSTEARRSMDPSRVDSMQSVSKDKKRGSSFLSRFISTKRRDTVDETQDLYSEPDDDRLEGVDASVFGESFDNMGYSPKHPQPPKYIKIRSKYKKEKEFNRVFLAQELRQDQRASSEANGMDVGGRRVKTTQSTEGSAVWAMQFSKDGKYLATAGQDRLVRVWAVLSSSEQRRAHEKEEETPSEDNEQRFHLSAPVFRRNPIKVYEGHAGPVLDLSWSKNNFLLSSSMDKTVRLWHISRSECLCAFKHNDFVTSIAFHPKDDRFFLAGSLDSKARLWSIPDKSVAFWNQAPEMITAVAFTPDGKTSIVGCLSGLCQFYETEGMKYLSQMHVKSARGKNAKGSKITGIKAVSTSTKDPNAEVKLLITSNDSRIRLYNYRDKSLLLKFKGNENYSSQIHANIDDELRYVVCGSEDKRVHIWSLCASEVDQKDKRPVEIFEAHSAITTVSVVAPIRTKQLLSTSEDPIYDLCNPPPVTLVSRSELNESPRSSIRVPSEVGSIQPSPLPISEQFKRTEESPAYIARTAHRNGNVIVTADAGGSIKVFRQDCAHEKRLADTSSLFSARGRVSTAILRRQSSLATHGSGRSRHSSSATQAILSWRQSIASTGSLDKTSSSAAAARMAAENSREQTRSASPRKSMASRFMRSVEAPTAASSSPALEPSTPVSVDAASETMSMRKSSMETASTSSAFHTLPQGERPANSRTNSYNYWRRDAWRDGMVEQLKQLQAEAPHESGSNSKGATTTTGHRDGTNRGLEPPPLVRGTSAISVLSSDLSSTEQNSADEAEQKRSGQEKMKDGANIEKRQTKCQHCGSQDFQSILKDTLMGKHNKLVCGKCGVTAKT